MTKIREALATHSNTFRYFEVPCLLIGTACWLTLGIMFLVDGLSTPRSFLAFIPWSIMGLIIYWSMGYTVQRDTRRMAPGGWLYERSQWIADNGHARERLALRKAYVRGSIPKETTWQEGIALLRAGMFDKKEKSQ